MKKKNLLNVFAMISLSWIYINSMAQEILTDDNYQYAYEIQLNYLTQLANAQGKELSEMPEYKNFCIWAMDYATRLDEEGNMSSYGEAIENYYIVNPDIESDFELDWQYNAPDSLWRRHDGVPTTSAGQGLIISLWVDPVDSTHFLAGCQFTGGLWETFDGGDNWLNITENYREIQGISSIFVDPLHPDTIYVTTAFDADGPRGYSNGVFYTEDGGDTWYLENCGNLYPNYDVHFSPRAFMKNPVNDSILYLLTPYRLYGSDDNGGNWEIIIDKYEDNNPNGFYNTYHARRFFNEMIFDPASYDTVYVTGPEAFKVFYNGDFGYLDITDSLLITTGSEIAQLIRIDAIDNHVDSIWFSFIAGQDDTLPDTIYLARYNRLGQGSKYTVVSTNKPDYWTGYRYLCCEVSPQNPDYMIIGGAAPKCIQFSDVTKFKGYGNCPGFHNDIRATEWPNNDFVLFGTDGGITQAFNVNPLNYINYHFQYIANDGDTGIRNIQVRGMDVSRYGEDMLGIGTEHDAFILKKDGLFQRIFESFGGDEESVLINPDNSNCIYTTQFGHPELNYTFDGGTHSYSFLYGYAYNWEHHPQLFFKPNDTGTIYAGFNGVIWEFNTSNISEPPLIHALPPDPPPTEDDYGDRYVKEIGINSDLRNIFFIATNRYWKNWFPNNWICESMLGWPHANAMLRVDIQENGEFIYTDLSSNMNLDLGLCGGPITGIAVEVNEMDTILYVSFGGTATSNNSQKNKKVYKSDDLGLNWTAMATGLPEKIPMNDIQFHRESGMLFAVNDVGVYYYDKDEITWKEITWNLPPMAFNKIRFSFLRNKILVSSFAKGVWEADIPCNYDNNSQTISASKTWNCSVPLHSDLVIDPGVTLTIKNEVYVNPQAKIIVKHGGKLIVDGGKITSSCGQLWQGIEVWGTSDQGQSPEYQGWVEVINGGTIENSLMGIYANKPSGTTEGDWEPGYTGGIVQCVDAEFINNKVAAQFFGYGFTSASHFTDCIFKTNDDYIGSVNPEFFIDVTGTIHLSITNCDFLNETETQYFQSGINSFNSILIVKGTCLEGDPCTSWDNGNFENLEYGIYATASTSTKYVDIRNTNFTGNFRGLYISGMTAPRVTSNRFYVNEPFQVGGGYGMYLDHSTGYWVEDNDFIHEGDSAVGVGLIVHHSGTAANEIYRNRFLNLTQGISAQEQNKGLRIGLQIKCNDFDECTADIFVPIVSVPGYGIASNQGSNSTLPENMAGNLFYIPSQNPDGDNDDINNQAASFTYYYPYNFEAGFVDVIPVDYTTNTVTRWGKTVADEWSYEIGCPSYIDGGGGGDGSSMLMNTITESDEAIEVNESQLTEIIDGGNTDYLDEEVENSVPPEAVQVYTELMSLSPYLSETVVSTSIEKENVLPNAMIRDVMVANPHTAKSDELIGKLDERSNPMPDYMKAQVLEGRDIMTEKQSIEADIDNCKLIKSRAFNELTRQYLGSGENTQVSLDSLEQLYAQDNEPESKYRLAVLKLEGGDYTGGATALENLPVQYGLTGDDLAAHEQMTELFDLVSGILSSGRTVAEADSSEVQQLALIETGGNNQANIYARNILLSLDEVSYDEPILLPDLMKSSAATEEYEKLLNAKPPRRLEVYPNPSKDFVIIGYTTDEEALPSQEGTIEIQDAEGRIIQTIALKSKKDQVTIITKDWKSGVYIASLKLNGNIIESIKFTLVK